MAVASTLGAPASEERPTEVRNVSTVTAAAIAVADMIGIGVFTSLGFQVADIPSGFAVLLLWVVGGVAALCGALSYAELGAALPRSGGEYNFLTRIYGPAIGFIAGWVSATVGFAAPVALAAMAFGEYFAGVVPGAPPLALGLGVVWLVALVHLRGRQLGRHLPQCRDRFEAGAHRGADHRRFGAGHAAADLVCALAEDLHYISGAPFAVGLVFVMYAYSGWNAATYIAGEVHDPQKSLPRALMSATLMVLVLYVGLNAVFLYTTPIAAMAGQDRRRADRRQAHLRRGRRPLRRRADLLGARVLDQRHDLDRPARHHGDGRGHPHAARLCAPQRKRCAASSPSCSSSPSRRSC